MAENSNDAPKRLSQESAAKYDSRARRIGEALDTAIKRQNERPSSAQIATLLANPAMPKGPW